jgi:hypothetical protein
VSVKRPKIIPTIARAHKGPYFLHKLKIGAAPPLNPRSRNQHLSIPHSRIYCFLPFLRFHESVHLSDLLSPLTDSIGELSISQIYPPHRFSSNLRRNEVKTCHQTVAALKSLENLSIVLVFYNSPSILSLLIFRAGLRALFSLFLIVSSWGAYFAMHFETDIALLSVCPLLASLNFFF